jgi:phosphatidylglycerophosphate synthase
MSQEIGTSSPPIEATFKAREVEGVLDICFYRPIGFRLAQLFAKLKLTPSRVSVLAGICGVAAGHLYYYRDLRINIAGMALHVCANALDNADGQLARLTHRESREGRIVDSICDHLVFASVYLHLALRCWMEGASSAVFLLALAAAISHALQGAAADYYRTTYLHVVAGLRSGFDSSAQLRLELQSRSWRRALWKKLLLALYLSFTRQQELIAPRLKNLRDALGRLSGSRCPGWFRERYRELAAPSLKEWGLLMTNTRMLVLFFLLFIGQPVWYFWFELGPLNLLLVHLLGRQRKLAETSLRMLQAQTHPA